MEEKKMKCIAGALLVALAAVTVAWSQSTFSVIGAGATFPYPMYSKWFDEYHKKNPNLQINYQAIGSGGGIRQVTYGTVDFGATDAPMTDDQLKTYQEKHGCGILHFPTVLGAVVPTYNIPGVEASIHHGNAPFCRRDANDPKILLQRIKSETQSPFRIYPRERGAIRFEGANNESYAVDEQVVRYDDDASRSEAGRRPWAVDGRHCSDQHAGDNHHYDIGFLFRFI
jgi:hypothetical protein